MKKEQELTQVIDEKLPAYTKTANELEYQITVRAVPSTILVILGSLVFINGAGKIYVKRKSKRDHLSAQYSR